MRGYKITVIALATTALALAGCKDTERPAAYNKGVYGGKADTKLTPKQVETLRHRGMRSYR